MATMDEICSTCERCGRSVAVVVVDSADEELNAVEQAAVDEYETWFERFDPEQDVYACRCPDCVEASERNRWVRIGSNEFADHTAPRLRRRYSD
jgi:hypothetical protein